MSSISGINKRLRYLMRTEYRKGRAAAALAYSILGLLFYWQAWDMRLLFVWMATEGLLNFTYIFFFAYTEKDMS